MSNFNIWMQGYAATGSYAGAKLVAENVEAGCFSDACIKFSKTDEAKLLGNFDIEKLSFWGCRLFDNSTDALKAFG